MLSKNKMFLSSFLFALSLTTSAQALETQARNLILMDYETGQILYQKEAQKMVPPASMSKLMTIYMIFDKIKNGTLSLDDTFTVSENAWRKGGAASGSSTMFLKIGEKVRVGDLLQGIIVQSGNDACIVVAENISGSEEDFAMAMNQKAKELGLNHSHFANATGWPHPDHRMSVEDLAKLARRIITEFPEYYHIFSQKEYTHNGIKQGNRNPLLYSMPAADGLKTGHTEEAGFSLTASAKKGNRRLIGVMTGLKSNKERSEEADKIMNWGFREFDNYTILRQGTKVTELPVWMGKEESVGLVIPETLRRTIRKNQLNDVKLTAIYDKPVKAPIKIGDRLGTLKVEIPEGETLEVPLLADKNVERLGILGRIRANLRYLLFGAK